MTNSTHVGHLHADTKGNIRVTSVKNFKHFFTVVDEFSRFVYTRPVKSKEEVSEVLLRYIILFERLSGQPVLSLHSDNGSEFIKAKRILE